MAGEALHRWWEARGRVLLRSARGELGRLGREFGRSGTALRRQLGRGARELARRGVRLGRWARRAGTALLEAGAPAGPTPAPAGSDPLLERVRPIERERLKELLAAIRRLRARLARELPQESALPLREELRSSESELICLLLRWEDAGWLVEPVPARRRDELWDRRPEWVRARGPDEAVAPPLESPAAEASSSELRSATTPRPGPSEAASPAPAQGAEPTGRLLAVPSEVAAAEAVPEAGAEARRDPSVPAHVPEAPAYEEAPESPRPPPREGARPEERTAPSPADLARLRAHFERGDHVRLEVPGIEPASWISAIQWLDRELEGRQPGERVEVIHGFLQGRLAEVYGWPRNLQRAFVGWISSVLREAQDEAGIRDARLSGCFSALSAFSKRARPGWVPGLSRQNGPSTGSWREDAEGWLRKIRSYREPRGTQTEEAPAPESLLARVEAAVDRWREGKADDEEVVASVLEALRGGVRSDDARLSRLAEPALPLLEEVGGEKSLRSLRRKIRLAIAGREQPSEVEPRCGRWRHEALTRDATVLLAGGTPREDARQRLEQEVPFRRVDWPELTGSRAIQAAADRVRSGSYDMVILLTGFASHEIEGALAEACAAEDVPLVRVARGYGTAGIRHAIERALPPPAGGGLHGAPRDEA